MTKCKHTVMTPVSSILPGVSWRSANWIATWWYMGSNLQNLNQLSLSLAKFPFIDNEIKTNNPETFF